MLQIWPRRDFGTSWVSLHQKWEAQSGERSRRRKCVRYRRLGEGQGWTRYNVQPCFFLRCEAVGSSGCPTPRALSLAPVQIAEHRHHATCRVSGSAHVGRRSTACVRKPRSNQTLCRGPNATLWRRPAALSLIAASWHAQCFRLWCQRLQPAARV